MIIVGESEFSFHLGINLRDHGIPVMMFNLFENTSEKAHEAGFEVFKVIFYLAMIEFILIYYVIINVF